MHVLQFKFAPATTRVVAGRKPGENAFAMGSSARLKDAFSFPSDSVVNDAQPSEMDGFNGTHSNADFEDLICTIEHIFSISWPCFASRLVWFHFPDLCIELAMSIIDIS